MSSNWIQKVLWNHICGVLSFFTDLIDIHVYITYILVCWFDIIIYLWCKVNKIKLLWWGPWNLRNWATTNQSELTVQYIKSCIDMKALDQEIQHSMKKNTIAWLCISGTYICSCAYFTYMHDVQKPALSAAQKATGKNLKYSPIKKT